MKSISADTDLEQRVPVKLATNSARLYCHMFHRVTTFTPSCLPKKGPAILVCNHLSGLDPLVIQSGCKRLIIWMMAKEFYELKSLKWFFQMIEAIPVERSGRDMAATRAALRALGQGRVLGIFPEGTWETTRELLPFQQGVAMMAMKTKAPVYPAYIDGTLRNKGMLAAFGGAQEAKLSFGPPIALTSNQSVKPTLEDATDRIKTGVQRLKDEMERQMCRTGVPEFCRIVNRLKKC